MAPVAIKDNVIHCEICEGPKVGGIANVRKLMKSDIQCSSWRIFIGFVVVVVIRCVLPTLTKLEIKQNKLEEMKL